MGSIVRKKFFDSIRPLLFGGGLSQSAVTTIEALFTEWEQRKLTDLRWLAYMLATVLAECGRNMAPVREGFKDTDAQARDYVRSKGYPYAVAIGGLVYYGRGLVQLTWLDNYLKMTKALGIPLDKNPDLALVLANAVQIMFEGMLKAETNIGDFTGKSLDMYFNDKANDPVNARRIINKLDRAQEIAGYHEAFLKALHAAYSEAASPPVPAPAPVTPSAPAAPANGRWRDFFSAMNKMFGRE